MALPRPHPDLGCDLAGTAKGWRLEGVRGGGGGGGVQFGGKWISSLLVVDDAVLLAPSGPSAHTGAACSQIQGHGTGAEKGCLAHSGS